MKLLTPFEHGPSVKYRRVSLSNVIVDLETYLYPNRHEYWCEDKALCVIENNKLEVFSGYAWDLCSPAVKIFGRYIGTPSKGYELKSFLHDVTRQCLSAPCCPWTRRESDDMFYNAPYWPIPEKPRKPSLITKIYHGAISGPAGDLYIHLTKKNGQPVICKTCKTIHI